MEPILVDNFDLLILRFLFPNHKKAIEELRSDIYKELKKKLLNTIHIKQFKRINNIPNHKSVSVNQIIKFCLEILFNLEIEELEDEITFRLEEKLSKIVFKDNGHDTYYLSKEGIQYYNRCWNRIRPKVIDLVIKIIEFPFRPMYEVQFSPSIVIMQELSTLKYFLLHLGLGDIKGSHLSFRSILDKFIYIRGEIDYLGIVQKLYFIRDEAYSLTNEISIELTDERNSTGMFLEYTVTKVNSGEQYLLNGSLIEPEIPLQEEFWNVSHDEIFDSLRSGLQVKLDNPKIIGNYIDSLEQCTIESSPSLYFEEKILDFFTSKLVTKPEGALSIKIEENNFAIILWEELESELGYSKQDIKKFQKNLKNTNQPMFIHLEGKIRKKELKRNQQGINQWFYYLEEIYVSSNWP